jgi:hypothetical protein
LPVFRLSRFSRFKVFRGWPRQLVAWVAQQQEEQLHNLFDIIEDLLAFGHRQFLPVPPVKG